MAKHPHRLLLNNKKTWRCTLPGCRYFIHIGLAHILPGMQSVCWECGDEFTLTEDALQDDQPNCDMCRNKRRGGPSQSQIQEIIEIGNLRAYMNTHGIKSVNDLTHAQKSILHMNGVSDRVIEMIGREESQPVFKPKIVPHARKSVELNDEIEIIEPLEITDEYPWLKGGNGDDEG